MTKIYIPKDEASIPENIKKNLSFDDGFYFEDSPENRSKFQDYIPIGFKKNVEQLKIDLIPKNSWGASLANSLTPTCWSSIRKPFIAHYGNRCQLCGNRGKQLSNSIRDVDTHELWEYNTDKKENVQKLVGFLSLCSSCHLMFHLGFARVKGKESNTIKRLQKLEKMTKAETDKRIKDIYKTWETRSQYNWKIDISILKEYGITEISFKSKTDKSVFIL